MTKVVPKNRKEEAVYQALRGMDTEEIQRRLDVGRMTPMAVSAAQSELERRGMNAPSRQIESLSAIYRQMNRNEILRRLDSGELSPTAAAVARDELDRREKVAAAGMVVKPPLPDSPYASVTLIVTGLLMLAYSAVMMRDYFLLVLLIVLWTFTAVFSKAFPRLGLILGIFFATTPIWLTVFMWKHLAWQSGDFKPLDTIISWFVLIIGSMIGVALASGFFKGALHKGSWGSLVRDVKQDRLDAINKLSE